jgi:hypothetical protein
MDVKNLAPFVVIMLLCFWRPWLIASGAATINLLLVSITCRYVEYPFCSAKPIVLNAERPSFSGTPDVSR